MAQDIPVLDELRAAPTSDGQGVVVEISALDGRHLAFGMHRIAVGAVAASLLDALARAPAPELTAPPVRVPVDAAGIMLSEHGETLLVLETGGAALAYALSPAVLAQLCAAIAAASSLPPGGSARHPTNRRHDA